MKKSIVEFTEILSKVYHLGWEFEVHEQDNGETYLQLRWKGACADSGEVQDQLSRKWKLSAFMTKSEVVQTAFKAVLTAMEHEVRENFSYRGKPIFGPHFDVDDLAERFPAVDAREVA